MWGREQNSGSLETPSAKTRADSGRFSRILAGGFVAFLLKESEPFLFRTVSKTTSVRQNKTFFLQIK